MLDSSTLLTALLVSWFLIVWVVGRPAFPGKMIAQPVARTVSTNIRHQICHTLHNNNTGSHLTALSVIFGNNAESTRRTPEYVFIVYG